MRKAAILPLTLHTLAGGAALLWLLWYFLPAGYAFKGLVTLLIFIFAGGLVWKSYRRQVTQNGCTVSMPELPLLDPHGPVVLVCGNGLDAVFQGLQMRKTAQGMWLRAGNVTLLAETVRCIQTQYPRQIGQLSVMYVCQPDKHQDEAVLRSTVKTLRQQINEVTFRTGLTPPVVVCCEFSGPETPWIIVRGDKPRVFSTNESPLTLIEWQQTDENVKALPVLSQAFSLIRKILLDELGKANRFLPSIRPFAVALRLGATIPASPSIWSQWLYRCTSLQFSPLVRNADTSGCFPDAILPLLAPFASPVQGGQRTRQVVLLVLGCAIAALGFSAINNSDLIRKVGFDLQRWSAISKKHSAPETQSLAALKQDALLLEQWQRQGQPVKYSLGYYTGQRLWLALQQAIDTYIPPLVMKPEQTPKIVRLDSMSLFDSGKAELKDSSAKVLVNALVGIKARPGWLIVVSGHTDNTGGESFNQSLSVQRAEAVRNWMRDTGDIPESCFAVQGYGDGHPIASNDTPVGRMHNRRVEITLVPQTNACHLPATEPASSDSRDVFTPEKGKQT